MGRKAILQKLSEVCAKLNIFHIRIGALSSPMKAMKPAVKQIHAIDLSDLWRAAGREVRAQDWTAPHYAAP